MSRRRSSSIGRVGRTRAQFGTMMLNLFRVWLSSMVLSPVSEVRTLLVRLCVTRRALMVARLPWEWFARRCLLVGLTPLARMCLTVTRTLLLWLMLNANLLCLTRLVTLLRLVWTVLVLRRETMFRRVSTVVRVPELWTLRCYTCPLNGSEVLKCLSLLAGVVEKWFVYRGPGVLVMAPGAVPPLSTTSFRSREGLREKGLFGMSVLGG